MAKSYLSKKHSPGFIAQVVNNNGDLTGFKIVVPWNSPKSFSLGAVIGGGLALIYVLRTGGF